MNGRGSKEKGADAERELSRFINSFGHKTRRGYVFYHESDVVGLKGIHIECKRHEQIALFKWMEQSERESKVKDGGIPSVWFRKNRKPWMIAINITNIPDKVIQEITIKTSSAVGSYKTLHELDLMITDQEIPAALCKNLIVMYAEDFLREIYEDMIDG